MEPNVTLPLPLRGLSLTLSQKSGCIGDCFVALAENSSFTKFFLPSLLVIQHSSDHLLKNSCNHPQYSHQELSEARVIQSLAISRSAFILSLLTFSFLYLFLPTLQQLQIPCDDSVTILPIINLFDSFASQSSTNRRVNKILKLFNSFLFYWGNKKFSCKTTTYLFYFTKPSNILIPAFSQ